MVKECGEGDWLWEMRVEIKGWGCNTRKLGLGNKFIIIHNNEF